MDALDPERTAGYAEVNKWMVRTQFTTVCQDISEKQLILQESCLQSLVDRKRPLDHL